MKNVRAAVVGLFALVALAAPTTVGAEAAGHRVLIPVVELHDAVDPVVVDPLPTPTGVPPTPAVPRPTGVPSVAPPTSTPVPTAPPSATPPPTSTATATTTRTATAVPTATASPTLTNSPTPFPTATPTTVPTTPPTAGPPAPPPPPQPSPIATALPDPRADVDLVFLTGLNTTGTSSTFDTLKAQLRGRGWTQGQMLTYSYRGGSYSAGLWNWTQWACNDSYQDVDVSSSQLEWLLYSHAVNYPGRKVILVGHSFGGLLGIRHLDAWQNQGGQRYNVVGLVTVDAPLHGVSSDKASVAWWGQCLGAQERSAAGLGATSYMSSLYATWAATDSRWVGVNGNASRDGVTTRTIGNRGDCVYDPGLAGCDPIGLGGSPDDRETQYLFGARQEYAVPIDPTWPFGFFTGRSTAAHGALLNVSPYVGYVADTIEAEVPRR